MYIFAISGHYSYMIKKFIICGLIGWLFEILWTGFLAFRSNNYTLTATTSLWMFPIYGLAAFIWPMYGIIYGQNIIIRGGIYTLAFFLVEYLTGSILKTLDVCPWDYSGSPYNVSGLIRLDYAPLWFMASLIFEFILRKI